MNTTPVGERASIVIFGCCNAGKSSLINAITSQNIAIVSDIRGTTTDPVKKTMELLPFGPVVITDTPGLDDKSTLGTLRVEKSLDYINQSDLILFVVDASREATPDELTFIDKIKSSDKKYLIVGNKYDYDEGKGYNTFGDSYRCFSSEGQAYIAAAAGNKGDT